MLNFTMSKDGRRRASVSIKFRFDPEEMVGIVARQLWAEYTNWGEGDTDRFPGKTKIEAEVRGFFYGHGMEDTIHSESLPDEEWDQAEKWAYEVVRFHFPELGL